MNWDRSLTPTRIKRTLPLEYVCWVEGIALEPSYDGRLIGPCPFHNDEHPSFAVFGDDLDKVGCWACDFRYGDVFDLLQRTRECNFKTAAKVANELLIRFEADDDWSRVPRVERPVFDATKLMQLARQAWTSGIADLGAVRDPISVRTQEVDAAWLHREFFIGVVPPATVVIPHFTADRVLTGVKLRYNCLPTYGVGGSRFPQLYGIWRHREYVPVVLCEGESDTWTAAWRWPEFLALGLPTGAGTYPRPELLEQLRGRPTYIVFDGDESGRFGAARWAEALGDDGILVDTPEGEDLTSWKNARLPD
ncbi:MAG: CHC2 zinc finger domain-containing protein [Vicinamibacterales bacterium]